VVGTLHNVNKAPIFVFGGFIPTLWFSNIISRVLKF
jgi:hypothetical protein